MGRGKKILVKKARCGREIFEHIAWDCSSNDHRQCRGEYDRDSGVTGRLHIVCACTCHGKPRLCKKSRGI